ncbi:glycosyl transferase family 2 [Rhodovulum bhavnagarense]|uniref:Glycosyl transferase family 2 n=1 Tax=Rhodovulum bhavnagarense TaxID=992286 RepID=A0A4R2RCD8_9RHOB|nr:glycosyltransferase family 2 protein [Rhodovulum bhavnagarense]TCP59908.1 glycosyl transferase family 2 [Rhodovulum bhavnagarense]
MFAVRCITPVASGKAVLFDAVAHPLDGGQVATLFFNRTTPPEAIASGAQDMAADIVTIANSPVLRIDLPAGGEGLTLRLDGRECQIAPHPAEPGLLAGHNVALALRNGESVRTVADWLDYHIAHHGLTGALILSRAQPGTDSAFAAGIEAWLAGNHPDFVLLLVEIDYPLGNPVLPPEAHPYCAPDAPGKDRMDIPPPDPWRSPLAEFVLYEWARTRFLGQARAVCALDVSDLLSPHAGPNVFDLTASSETGYVQLLGRNCYPWRVRKGAAATFGDHTCVQFDNRRLKRRWCVAPAMVPRETYWRQSRIGRARPLPEYRMFHRFMAIRHPTDSIATIVPKTSLIERDDLIALATGLLGHKPVPMPAVKPDHSHNGRRAIVTTMKNEGPFILEWIAYHRAIGVDDFLIYTNDCTDGTDELLDILQDEGIVQHRDNPFRGTGLKPQHAALQAAESEPLITGADWAICMDVDEYIDVKCGDGTLDALFAAVGDVNMISLTWRLYGNSDVHAYQDRFVIDQFTRCAREFANKPHQAWGFKTLFRNIGLFKKLGVHRPKGLNPQLWEQVRWVNGSGQPMPREMYRNAWRSTAQTYGYDLVQLNHYAVRSAESFLVKRDRGRVNHVDRDQGLAYWFRMNNNEEEDNSIRRMIPAAQAEFDRLMAVPRIAGAHNAAVTAHRAKIAELRASGNFENFYAEITGERMQRLSRLHRHFGANVFLRGPECVPDAVVARGPDEDFFFTVEAGETAH